MSSSRRDFLKLLGLGGAAAAVGVDLFSSQAEASPVSPISTLLGGRDHFVFDTGKGPLIAPDATTWFLFKEDDVHAWHDPFAVVGLRNPKRHSKTTGDMPWAPYADPLVYQSEVQGSPDPIVDYYMAATQLQRKIHEDTLALEQGLQRRGLVMVTCVDCPIMAFPLTNSGFYLETQLRQFAVRPEDLTNRDRAISSRGEVPIDEPNAITMKYMMKVQEELKLMGMLPSDSYKMRQKVEEAARRVRAQGLVLL